MGILPLGGAPAAEDTGQTTRTWCFDRDAGRLTAFTDGRAAMVQAVEIALSIRRFHWQIYTPNFGTIYDDLPGREYGLVCSEIRRRTLDALSADDRITGVEAFRFRREGDSVTVSFTVKTVFGDVRQEVTV